jgi:hypothetical protein
LPKGRDVGASPQPSWKIRTRLLADGGAVVRRKP